MTDLGQSDRSGEHTEVRKRSSVFFASDVSNAAETAAFMMEEHGLTDDQAVKLGEKIESAILDFYEARSGMMAFPPSRS